MKYCDDCWEEKLAMTSVPEEFATFFGSVTFLNFCLRESLINVFLSILFFS